MSGAPADIALMQTIIEQPDDDTPRLIYADWLEEQGQQPRGEFIRVQCEAADLFRRGKNLPRAFGLRERQNALLRKHEKTWIKEFQPFVENWTFERGFIEYVALAAQRFLEQGDFLFARAPLRRLYLLKVGELLPQVVQSSHLARLNTLYLHGVPAHHARLLAESPYLDRMTSLTLMGHSLPGQEQRLLAAHFGDRIRF